MRNWLLMASGGLMLTGCGGGSGGATSSVAVVSGTPAPAPTPTPTPTPAPTPTPTPTPTPSSAYPRYADLSGDRSFGTACASLLLGTDLPSPQPALAYGEALTLSYAASSRGWTIGGDGVAQSFGSADAVAAPAGQLSYEHVTDGSPQRFTIMDPIVGGSTFDFTRSLALRTDRAAGSTLYSCVFGVPTATAAVPMAAITYARISIGGTAYVGALNGAVQSYALSGSTGTVSVDATGKVIKVSVHLLGNLQTASGVATAVTDLGSFAGTAALDPAQGKFTGQLDGTDRVSLFSSFSGWFFGDTESGSAFEILAIDTTAGSRLAAVGTIAAAR